MAQIQPGKPAGRRAVRYGIPVAVAGAAAATIGLVPALASTGSPDLPKISAQQLLAKMAASDTQRMSGTVRITTDLGLPQLPGGEGGQGGGPFGGGAHSPGHGRGAGGSGDAAAPQKKLMELASGEHTLRMAVDGPRRQRVSIVEDAAEYSLIHNGSQLWAYDSATNNAYHAKVPAGAAHAGGRKDAEHDGKGPGPGGPAALTPQEAAKRVLKAVDGTTSVSVDGTQKIAGRDAYQLVLTPERAADSTVGQIRVGVDADTGVPLTFTLAPRGGGKAIVDARYTKVDFSAPDADSFRFKAPKGTKVTEEKPGEHAEHGARAARPDLTSLPGLGLDSLGKGWGTVTELSLPRGAAPGAPKAGGGGAPSAPQAQQLLGSVTQKVTGDFGTGRVFSTRLVNVLLTDDGKVYAGAVTKQGLVKAADKAAR